MKIKVAIIGAGPAGLAALKELQDEGFEPVLFEKSSHLGGVWSGGENGLAWSGMHTNISKWSCMFSDFPWPAHIQDFPTREEMTEYLDAYADAFGLRQHIRLQSEVTHISESENKKEIYVTANGQTEVFDFAISATGFFAKQTTPDLPYKDFYDGEILHASQIKSAHQIAPDKKIVVYGGSLSGYELASEFARVSHHPVVHGFSKPAWVMNRYLKNSAGDKIPLDLGLYVRKDPNAPAKSQLDIGKASLSFLKAAFGNPGDVHPALTVGEDPLQPRFCVISDHYLDAVRQGKIIPIRGEIGGFDRRAFLINAVKGNIKPVHSDVTVMATGYHATLPYLDDAIKTKIGYDEADQFMPVPLSDTIWPRNIKTLAFVGFYRGPYFGVMELQARWIAGVLSGRLPAPSNDDIEAGVTAALALKDMRPRPQFPYADYVGLADSLARKVGCYPDLDPTDRLYNDVAKGFFLPSHYRLKGPQSGSRLAFQVMRSIPYVK